MVMGVRGDGGAYAEVIVQINTFMKMEWTGHWGIWEVRG